MSAVTPSSVGSGAPDDRTGFGDWIRPHWAGMAALARRLSGPDWEDVLQDALSTAWRKRAQFDESRGSARNWLLAIVADKAAKRRRLLARWARPVPADPEPVVDDVGDDDLEAAVRRLAPRQRVAVTLHYFLSLPIADVAAVMGCSAGTVKSTLADARTRLRSELGEDYR